MPVVDPSHYFAAEKKLKDQQSIMSMPTAAAEKAELIDMALVINAKKQAQMDLDAKLDSAYTQLRDLATKTVESSGSLKVISTSGDSSSTRK